MLIDPQKDRMLLVGIYVPMSVIVSKHGADVPVVARHVYRGGVQCVTRRFNEIPWFVQCVTRR